jgi:putative phosphoribosyl transferase
VPDSVFPARPNLEQYKKQAKDLLKDFADGGLKAMVRVRHHHPRLQRMPDADVLHAPFKLSDAQLVIAREHTFESWPRFAAHIRGLGLEQSVGSRERAVRLCDSTATIRVDGIDLAVEIRVPTHVKGLVLFPHASGSARSIPRNLRVAEVLSRSQVGTVLADLLTEEEDIEDALTEKYRFDLPMLTGRIAGLTNWIAQQPGLEGQPLGYLGTDTGAAAALWCASRGPGFPRAAVSLGGRADLAGPRLGYLQTPTLFIAGNKNAVLLEMTRFAFWVLPPETTSDFEVIEGATHSLREDDAFSKGVVLARAWFERYLR